MRLPFDLDRPIAFIDLETTGLDPRVDRIVELGLLRFAPDGSVLERVRRFNPGQPIPIEASRVHGITDEAVASEPYFSQVAKSLFELLDPCDLGGFNIRRFDLPMLIAEFRRAGIAFDAKTRRILDVQAVFHREERRDLTAATRFYLGTPLEGAHSALADVKASAAILAAQLERYPHLPRDVEGLNGYCDDCAPIETEMERWFTETDSGPVFRRGKHRGRALHDVAANERDYLDWMLGLDDMDEDVRNRVREVLIQVRAAMAQTSLPFLEALAPSTSTVSPVPLAGREDPGLDSPTQSHLPFDNGTKS